MVIALCDDDYYVRDYVGRLLESYLAKVGLRATIVKFACGRDLLLYMDKIKEVDLIFLDIKMPRMNGMEVAKEIRKFDQFVDIVFLTSYGEEAIEGYKVRAVSYMLKPVNAKVFNEEMDRIVKKGSLTEKKYIIVKEVEGFFKVNIEDISFVETVKSKTMVHMGDRKILSYMRMKEYEKKLGTTFFRCHRAYIVNLAYVNAVEDHDVILNDREKTVIQVSRYRRSELLERLAQFYTEDF